MHKYLVTLSDGSHFWVNADNWYEAMVDAIRETKRICFNGKTIQSISILN